MMVQQYNITAETLKQLSISIWDLMLAFFNQAFLCYNQINAHFKLTQTVFALFMQLISAVENFSKYLIDYFYNSAWANVVVDFLKVLYYQKIPSTDEIQQKWIQINEQYKLTETASALFTRSQPVVENLLQCLIDEIQQKWIQINEQYKLRGFSIVDRVHDQWNHMADTTTPDYNIFTQFFAAIQTFFRNLIPSFTDILPIAAHYLLAAVILIACICFIVFFFSCLVSTFSFLFMCISSVVRYLFMGIYSIVKILFLCIFYAGKFLYLGLSRTIYFIYSGLIKCMCVAPPAVKMMVAPGRAPLMMARAAFEASPKAYFAALRMVSG